MCNIEDDSRHLDQERQVLLGFRGKKHTWAISELSDTVHKRCPHYTKSDLEVAIFRLVGKTILAIDETYKVTKGKKYECRKQG